MRTRNPTRDPDIEPEYDFHGAELNPYAKRYREAERHGRLRMPEPAPVAPEQPARHRGVATQGLLERWRHLHRVDPEQHRADLDEIIDQTIE
jgi:hypothetical protein